MTQIPGEGLLVNLASPFVAGEFCLLVTATTSGGAHTVHTAQSGTAGFDAVFLMAQNTSGSNVDLTIEIGAIAPASRVTVSRNSAPIYVLPSGYTISNSKTIRAYAATGSAIVLFLKVVRYTNSAV